METTKTEQFLEENTRPAHQTIFTISAIALDFDYVSSDPSKSRANEIKVLLVRNKKPARNSKEGKPGGSGLPTGQLESHEGMLEALKRETRDESGCSIKKTIGKLFAPDIVSSPTKVFSSLLYLFFQKQFIKPLAEHAMSIAF